MTNYFIVPGLGNSGEQHWQSFFESTGDNFKRIQQQEWDAPDRADWVATVDKAISGYDPATVVLVGHSLGCLTIAHWAVQYGKKIKGALLVAPSDFEAPQYTFPATGFAPVPKEKINFPTIIVASTNDQWISLGRAQFFADNWGSEFINVGEAGHINTASGHYQWHEGLAILKTLG